MVRSVFLAEQPSLGDLTPSTTAADYVNIPITNESVRASSSSTTSAIIRDDRQPQDQVRTGFEVQGPINSEMMAQAFDSLLEAGLFSADWATVNSGVQTGSLAVTAGTKNVAMTSAFAGAAVGDWFRIEKAASTNNGIVCRIVTVNGDDDVTVDSVCGSSATLTDLTSTSGYTLRFGKRIVGGNTRRDFTYVKKLSTSSGSTIYEAILGVLVNGFSFQMQPNSIITCSFDLFGRKVVPEFDGNVTVNAAGDLDAGGTAINFASYLASGFTAAPSRKVYSAISDATIVLDKTVNALMTSYQLNASNNVTGEGVIGVQGSATVEEGNASFTGQIEAILDDTTLYTKFINDGVASIATLLSDAENYAYVVDIPSVKLNDGGTSIPGQQGSVKLPLSFGAGVDSVTNRAIQIVRFYPSGESY